MKTNKFGQLISGVGVCALAVLSQTSFADDMLYWWVGTTTFDSMVSTNGSVWVGSDNSSVFASDWQIWASSTGDTDCGITQYQSGEYPPNIRLADLSSDHYGRLKIASGLYHAVNDIVVGCGGNADAHLWVNGGRLECVWWMSIGGGNKDNVTVDVDGTGVLFVGTGADNNAGSRMRLGFGDSSVSTLTIADSGAVTCYDLWMAEGSDSTATINLDGGTLSVAAITNGAGTATVNMNGGTLKPTADGVLIPSGVTLTIGDTESTIELTGQTVTIDGALAGLYGTAQTTGVLTVKGWGTLVVTGEVKLDTLTVEPSEYYTSGSDYSLTLDAKSVFVRHLYGAGDITTRSGVNTGDGTFYGRISGAGGFRTRGATTLYGLSDYTGGLTFATGASLYLVSSLDGLSPLWRLDASDGDSITESNGYVTQWNSLLTSGYLANAYFANSDSVMYKSTDYFGGKTSVVTAGSTLTSSWNNDGSSAKNYHTQRVFGSVAVIGTPSSGALLMSYTGRDKSWMGSTGSRWTMLPGSSAEKLDGMWQNGVYKDTEFKNDASVIEFTDFSRMNMLTTVNIGGDAGSLAIGELVAFNEPTTISTSQRKQIETYLANKWGIEGMGSSVPEVNVSMTDNTVFDLGGLAVTVKGIAFAGTCVVQNGTLTTATGVITQGEGDLTIPAVEGVMYIAKGPDYKLIITGCEGKTVKVQIPADWGDVTGASIYCEGDIEFTYLGDEIEFTKTSSGWWYTGDTIWSGGSTSETKYWEDEANWNGAAGTRYLGTAAAGATINFGDYTTLEGCLWMENGNATTFTGASTSVGMYQPYNTGYNTYIGGDANGALVVEDGKYHFANDLVVGCGGKADNITGSLVINGGRVETAYWLQVCSYWGGVWHDGTYGYLEVNGGELVTGVRDGVETGDGAIELCRSGGASAAFVQNGGTVSSSAGKDSGTALVIASDWYSSASYTLNGGSYTARSGSVMIARDTGTTGTLYLNGGTFTAAAITNGLGTATVNLNGGTLCPTQNGVFIYDGVTVVAGDTESTIYLTGQDVTIQGNIMGPNGTDSTSGALKVAGWGTLRVTGEINVSYLTVEPNNYYTSSADTYTLNVIANKVYVRELWGAGNVSTARGVNTGGGSFYGKLSGAGGLRSRGATTLYGLHDFTGEVQLANASSSLSLVSSLDGISPLWRLDAESGAKSSNGKIIQWALADGAANFTSVVTTPIFLNSASAMVKTTDYFGGKTAVLTSGSTLTSTWTKDGEDNDAYHTKSLVGAVAVAKHDSNAILLTYNVTDGKSNFHFGRYNAANDYWAKQHGSGESNKITDGIWQNGAYGDKTFYNSGKVLSMIGWNRYANASSIMIGGGSDASVAIGELIAFNSNPTTAQLRQMETYLANKWNIDGMGASLPEVSVNMSAGGTLDLGGLDVKVASFRGYGTVQNGTLTTTSGVITQGDGDLTVPASEDVTYVASSSSHKLIITGGSGKTVKVKIPEGWLVGSGNLIFCEGEVDFDYEGNDTIEWEQRSNGWWYTGDTTWTGESTTYGDVKYWSDESNWTGTDAERHFTYGAESPEVTFGEAVVHDGRLWFENGTDEPIVFIGADETVGLSQTNSYHVFIGGLSSGSLAVEGGKYHFANDLLVGYGAKADNVTGDFTLDWGRVETEYWLVAGLDDDTSHTGVTGNIMVNGGVLNMGVRKNSAGEYVNSENGCIQLGRAAGSTTTFTQNDGAVSSQSGGKAGENAMVLGASANTVATYSIYGGSYTARTGKILIAEGSGSAGALNVYGGTVYAAAITNGLGTATVNIDGGTLYPTAGGVFIPRGVTVNVGDNGGTIYLAGHDVMIDGDITGTGSLTVTGWGTLRVNGAVSIASGILTVTPNEYYSNEWDNYTIELIANSVYAGALEGAGTVTTSAGVNVAGGSFYGKVSGAGGFRTRGATTLYGLHDFTNKLTFANGGSLKLVSGLDGITPLWRLDASDTNSLTIADSKVTKWNVQNDGGLYATGYFANESSAMVASMNYFGGMQSILTSGSTLTSSWSNDGNADSYHTKSLIGSVAVVNHNDNAILVSFNTTKGNNFHFGRYNANHDFWAKQHGSGESNMITDGIWQDGVYGETNFFNKGTILSIEGWNRYSLATSVNIGGGVGSSVAIGELLAFNDNPTACERKQIEAYLARKWSVSAMGAVMPEVDVEMTGPNSTFDLGGLDLTVASFTGSGTVQNGVLRTSDGTYTQGAGKLTIPAVDGARYVASKAEYGLEITDGYNADGTQKEVTIVIPADWDANLTGKIAYIFCQGEISWEWESGTALEFKSMGDGRYRFGTATDHIEYEGFSDNTADNVYEEARDDSESGLAFPGAYGFGRFAVGARASKSPTVYHVTNLNDSGTGSLRDAVSKPNRIVVFDVSGVIKISSRITFSSNLYVAGQTAPGEGITVYGDGCSFSGASNIICRYLRWRMGHIGSSGKDCAGIANGANMIFDHCSFSWGLDETFSINPDNKGTYPNNITLQNCIFGQGLMTHSAGGLMQATNITLYRNLYCDNSTRNNKVKGVNQYVNNIVYNWKNGCYIMGGDSEGTSYCTIVGNYFVNGPVSSSSNAFGGGNSDFHFYGIDNWQDKNRNGKLDGSCIDGSQTGGGDSTTLAVVEAGAGVTFPTLPLYAGNTLLDNNLRKVGASLPYRDQSDCYMIDEVQTHGSSGALITYEDKLPIGAPDTWSWWKTYQKPTDTDGDGMPDSWETANGLNPKSTSDAVAYASNGRLNIENYINSLSDPENEANSRQYHLRPPVTLSVSGRTTTRITLSWRDYTYGERGFLVEILKDGTWEEAGTTGPGGTSCTIGNLTSGTAYTFRVMAVGRDFNEEDAYSDAVEISATTRQEESEEIDIDTYLIDSDTDYVEYRDGQTLWRITHRYSQDWWKDNKMFVDGNKVLLDTDTEQTLSISEDTVQPHSIVANGTGWLQLKNVYRLAGTMSLNKGNSGTLKLVGAAPYTGKVVNHGGTIEFDTIANGGSSSSLGASSSDALNWVFDGGVYNYVGGNASSDRSMTFRQDGTLSIGSAKTLKLTGVIEGDGDFILDGVGTLDLPDAHSFFGTNKRSATVKGGTLYLSTTGGDGSAKYFLNGYTVNSLTLAGGTVKFASANEEYQTYDKNIPIYVEDGTSSELELATHCYMDSPIKGNGDLTLIISGPRSYITSSMSSFTGDLTVYGRDSDSLFIHEKQWGSYKSTRFNLTGQIYMTAKTTNARNYLGGLSGDAGTYLICSSKNTSNANCVWYVGYANSDETFNGIINNCYYSSLTKEPSGTSNSIVKYGTGFWRLGGNNTYRGTTDVYAGDLIVNGTHSGTGAYTVRDGGTLRGTGTINADVTVMSGGTIKPGDYGEDRDDLIGDNLLTFNGNVTFEDGSRLIVPLRRDGSTIYRCRPKFNSGKTLTIKSGAVLELDISEVGTPLAGDKYIVLAYSGNCPTLAGAKAFTIEPESPGRGLLWDTSKLYSDKYISVVADSSYVPDLDPLSANSMVTDKFTATVPAVSEKDAYDYLDVVVPTAASNNGIDADTFKGYFKYAYTDKGNGCFDVQLVGIADEVVEVIVESAKAALFETAGSDGCVPVTVYPGLYYSMTSGTSANLTAGTRYLKSDTAWRVTKPSGDARFVRIDIGVGTSDTSPFVSTSVIVAAFDGSTFSKSLVANPSATLYGKMALPSGATLSLDSTQTSGLADGSAFTIVDNPENWTMEGTFASISPSTPGTGLLWDTSKLYDGSMTLSVVADPDYNPTVTITASAGSGGTISPNGATTVTKGESKTFTITPNTGYQVASVLVDGKSVGAVTSYKFSSVDADHTIAATFKKRSYNVTVNGKSTTYEYGTSVTFTAPDPTCDSLMKTQIVYLATTYTAPVVTNEFVCTITNSISFSWDILGTNYWFEAQTPTNGGITFTDGTAAANAWMARGTNFTLVATPSDHYSFAKWTGDISDLSSSGNTLSVVMSQARSIGAEFEIVKYDASEESEAMSEELADALVEAGVADPTNGLSSTEIADYKSYVKLVKTGDAATGYYVSVVVTQEGTNVLERTLETEVKELIGPRIDKIAAGELKEVEITGVPGFWYSVESGTNLGTGGMSEGDRHQAGTGGAVELNFPHYDKSGFYQILINVKDK